MLLAIAVAASVIGLALDASDALLAGFLASLGAILLLVTGAARSHAAQRHPEG